MLRNTLSLSISVVKVENGIAFQLVIVGTKNGINIQCSPPVLSKQSAKCPQQSVRVEMFWALFL